MDGEGATAPEDVSKWTVDDVCSFVGGLSGCGEYAPVRGPAQDGLSTPASAASHPKFLLKDCGGGVCTSAPSQCLLSVLPPPRWDTCLTHRRLSSDAFSCKLRQPLLLALLSLESFEATPGHTALALVP